MCLLWNSVAIRVELIKVYGYKERRKVNHLILLLSRPGGTPGGAGAVV